LLFCSAAIAGVILGKNPAFLSFAVIASILLWLCLITGFLLILKRILACLKELQNEKKGHKFRTKVKLLTVFIFIRQALAIIYTITVQVKLTPEQATVRDWVTDQIPEIVMLISILAFFHPFQRLKSTDSFSGSSSAKDAKDSKDSKDSTGRPYSISSSNPTSTISIDSNPRQSTNTGTNSSISVDDDVV